MIMNDPSSVYEAVGRYRARKQEYFLVLTLDGAHQLIRTHVVTIGLVNRTIIHPREVFIRAIKDNSIAIILVHNHPSGKLVPSDEDKEITARLKAAGEIIGIEVMDHIIISKNGFSSLLELGLL